MIKWSENVKYGLIGGGLIGAGFLVRDILIASAGNIFAFNWNWQMLLNVLPVFGIVTGVIFTLLCLTDAGKGAVNKARSIIFNNNSNEISEKKGEMLLSLNNNKDIINNLYDNDTKKKHNTLNDLNEISSKKSRIDF